MTRWTMDDVKNTTAWKALNVKHSTSSNLNVGPAVPKPSKYRNVKTTDAAGNVHDSGKEYRRWCELQLREKAREISDLRRHVRYDFCFNGVFIGYYTADAVYVENGRTVVEDTKSPATRKIRDYPLRRNLMKACHGIELREV